MFFHLDLSTLILSLFAVPTAYFLISYGYLAWWHKKAFLWHTLIHENGRLTLLGSMFYFDHFLACVPMIALFALCAAGGFALGGRLPLSTDAVRATLAATVLLGASGLFVLASIMASIYTVGWQRTIDYAFQRIERDGIMSKGGSWNQLQLSNIPIGFMTIGVSSTMVIFQAVSSAAKTSPLMVGALVCIGIAATLCILLSMFNWCHWKSFRNPRWLAHSMRELATYPLTGIPIALASLLLVEYYLSGLKAWSIEPQMITWILLGASLLIVLVELSLLKGVNVRGMAQKPAFAAHGLSVPYLLCSHVFEHFLDFVLIGPLTAGIYALVRMLPLPVS